MLEAFLFGSQHIIGQNAPGGIDGRGGQARAGPTGGQQFINCVISPTGQSALSYTCMIAPAVKNRPNYARSACLPRSTADSVPLSA
jgi:hypothetical protein